MASVLRSIAFYLVFYGLSVGFVLASLAALPLMGPRYRMFPNAWSAFHRGCVRHILGIEVIEEGERASGPALYACKHESFFEAIDIATSLKDPVPFAKAELYDIPLWGIAARQYGSVPVSRTEGAKALRAMIAAAREFVDQGRSLVIFPEGTRIPHGERPPLRSGFSGLYKMLDLPVVPMAVNSGPLYQRWWKRRGRITIRFGQTIPAGLPRAEIEERVRVAINALNEGPTA